MFTVNKHRTAEVSYLLPVGESGNHRKELSFCANQKRTHRVVLGKEGRRFFIDALFRAVPNTLSTVQRF